MQWLKETSQFSDGFIKSYSDESDEGDFLEGDVQHPKNVHTFHIDLPFLPERMNIWKMLKTCSQLAW